MKFLSLILIFCSLSAHAALKMKVSYSQGGYVHKEYPFIRFLTLQTKMPSAGTWEISIMGLNSKTGNESCWIYITSEDKKEILDLYQILQKAKLDPATTQFSITRNTTEVASGPACSHRIDLRKDAFTVQVQDL
ncbi:MAG: hypothetical protein ACHQYQ_06020 [Bacteriovoracales bacterium]|jgi:hypothetical protein